MSHALYLAAAALFVCRLALFLAVHLFPGGIHPVEDTVSDYAASANALTRALSRLSAWAAALAWAALGFGLLTDGGPSAPRTTVGIWFLALALVLAIMPWVPTDGPSAAKTLRGRVHLLLAVAWFTISYSTIAPLARLLEAQEMHGVGTGLQILHVIAAISLAALVLSLLVRPLRSRSFGVSERVFILAVTIAPLLASLGFMLR